MSRLHFAFIVLIRCWSVPWSDLRCLGANQSDQSRATTSSHSQPERPARATSSSHSRFDASRHKKTRRERPPGATMLGRSACFAWTIFMLFQGPFVKYFVSHGRQNNLFSREELVEGLEGQEELCFINNNGSWYKKEPNFQYNNYQQKSYLNNQQSARATSPERLPQVTPSQSDQPERPAQVTRVLTRRDTKKRVGSDLLERLC
ncbi:hypothetical protein IGI04_008046 [Brassica rapa subsp. trilocularis]|uniref:Uncharacterized protein n=1 Tax=Brassica rapa subsp. trilocularis TaxID=1813537 RepID=A0ABQ7NLK3_BRACM|nr:hypothetical protein IGI04_008046 [Brassica rapa subsp. trilocularis]